MSEPDSFCFICTGNSSYELIGMLLSLSIYHRNAVVYGLIDSYTENILTNVNPTLRLKLVKQDNTVKEFKMATEHKHGSMDTEVQEKTFAGFINWTTKTVIVCILAIIFIAAS